MSKKGKKAAGDRKKATILVKVRCLGEKSALGMCERLWTDPAKNANRVTRAVGDLPRRPYGEKIVHLGVKAPNLAW